MKICSRCNVEKSYELFYKQKVNSKDGYQSHCKACDNIRKEKWIEKNPEIARLHRQKSDKNKYEKNKTLINAKNKLWKIKNPEKVMAIDARRRAAIKNRTPSWFTEDDHWIVEQAYDLAAKRTSIFGFSWHVDHIIPLQGKLVSGLHVPYNLQVIPAVENLKKSNKLLVTT